MIDTLETTYRITCDQCGYYAILTIGKYSAVQDPIEHFKGLGWAIGAHRTYCCSNCREYAGMSTESFLQGPLSDSASGIHG